MLSITLFFKDLKKKKGRKFWKLGHLFGRKTWTQAGMSRNMRLNNQEGLTWTAEGSYGPSANRVFLALDNLCKNMLRVRA